MSFRFPLAAVLRIRESLEHKEQLALEQCYQRIYSIQKRLSEHDEQLTAILTEYEARLIRGTKAVDLHVLIEQRVQIERERERTHKQLEEAQNRLREQMEHYRTARQKREILGHLRDTRFEDYQRREAFLEQKTRDDLFLLRRQRQK
jgi:flagellar export protein FliJ